MLKLLGWLIKSAIFAAVILVAANFFKVGNKTVSDQVKTQMSKAESSEAATRLKGWATGVASDTRRGVARNGLRPHLVENGMTEPKTTSEEGTEIPSSERQKLKALIRELNTSRSRD